jgi:hypothetical protein
MLWPEDVNLVRGGQWRRIRGKSHGKRRQEYDR